MLLVLVGCLIKYGRCWGGGVMLLCLCLSVCGCGSYGQFSGAAPATAYVQSPYNPNMLFDSERLGAQPCNAENFLRTPWPREVGRVWEVTFAETVTYDEDVYTWQHTRDNIVWEGQHRYVHERRKGKMTR